MSAWECPRCGCVNAPTARQCSCKRAEVPLVPGLPPADPFGPTAPRRHVDRTDPWFPPTAPQLHGITPGITW